MSKKKALDYDINYVHQKSRPEYASLDFLDKKGRKMRSSVDVLINLEYIGYEELRGYVLAR
jgi:hypothetical protein